MSAADPTRKLALPKSRKDYRVAIIVALPKEKDAIDAILEHPVSRKDAVKVSEGDDNSYDFGVLGDHHVVVAQLPGMGKVSAAHAAGDMRRSFPNIKLCLLVGICGIVPTTERDDDDPIERCLGDVVIADSIVQYDFGRGNESGFVRKSTVMDVPGRTSTKIRSILGHLRTWKGKKDFEKELSDTLEALLSRKDIPPSGYPARGRVLDQVYPPEFIHQHAQGACIYHIPTQMCDVQPPCPIAQTTSCERLGCDSDPETTLYRLRSPDPGNPSIFIGPMGVADLVQKSATSRDKIAAEEKVIAFEMESVGIWDHFPDVVVIKAACDYADSHKNDVFHRYASAAAATCAKVFLTYYRLDGNVRYEKSDDGAMHSPQPGTYRLSDRGMNSSETDTYRLRDSV